MKSLRKLLAATALTLTLAPVAANAANYVVVLSDTMPVKDARAVLNASKTIMGHLKPGDRVTFIDGASTSQFTNLAIPSGDEGKAILASKAKIARHFGPTLKKVQNYAVASTRKEEKRPAEDLPLQVNLPGVLYSLSVIKEQKPDVIFMGSLRYHDEIKMPGYSMAHKFPNDGHLLHSPSVTPYGAAGMQGILDGTRVHFCEMDVQDLKTIHRLGLERATGLLVQGYGAVLATSSSNLGACVTNAMAGRVDPSKTFTADPKQTKMVIYNVNQTAQMPATTLADQMNLLSTLTLTPQETGELLQRIKRKEVVLAEVLLYDTDADDGDVVALVSGTMRLTTKLTKTAQKVVVPITNGTLTMEGVHDGGGGITVGVKTKLGEEIVSPVMKEGETIALPFVRFSPVYARS